MGKDLNIYDIYEQNLNFLFGSGASYGFLPTLELSIKDGTGKEFTLEVLAKKLDDDEYKKLYTLLFMYYYKKCISMGLPRLPYVPLPPQRREVLEQYKRFIKTLIKILDKQGRENKKCNIYTVNYDSCFELASDSLLVEQSLNFVVNDGSSGFQNRRFHTKNFNNRVVQKGIFDRHAEVLPQLNILHPHGSVYWQKDENGIGVSYGQTPYDIQFSMEVADLLARFSELLECPSSNYKDLVDFGDQSVGVDLEDELFWRTYNRIPIVNPTKWKFHETVFEEAYYQILRHLSFELEKPNSILITFGFSFADEHILHLVQRSLSNPSLTIYVCCFNKVEEEKMKNKFKGFDNVNYISIDEDLNFRRFNNKIFTLNRGSE